MLEFKKNNFLKQINTFFMKYYLLILLKQQLINEPRVFMNLWEIWKKKNYQNAHSMSYII